MAMADDNKGQVPQLRFEGFNDPWQQRKLVEIAKQSTGGGTPSTSNEDFWGGDIPWLQSSDLTEHDLFGINARKRITQNGLKNSAAKLVSANSIAIITRVGVGKLAVVPFEYTTSQDFLSLSTLNIDVLFGAYSIYTRVQKDLSQVQGTSIKGITKDELLNKVINVPHDAQEQTSIGTYFHTLDNLITSNQRKLEGLKELKKGYLQQMFPQAGESVPRIRFEGFTEPWQQRKLGEVLAEKISNGIMNKPGRNELNIKHINVVNLYSPSYIHLNELEYINASESDLKRCNVEMGDIFLTRSSLKADGIAQANILLDDGLLVFDDHIMRIKFSDEFEPFFVKEALNHSPTKKQFMTKSKTGTMTTIGQEDISSSTLSFPTKPEQTAIGNFFKSLDAQIIAQAQKVDSLKSLKSAYLQRMFI